MAAGYKQYETHTPNPYFVGFCGTSEAQCTADRFSSYYEMIWFDYYLTLKLTGFSCRFFLKHPGVKRFVIIRLSFWFIIQAMTWLKIIIIIIFIFFFMYTVGILYLLYGGDGRDQPVRSSAHQFGFYLPTRQTRWNLEISLLHGPARWVNNQIYFCNFMKSKLNPSFIFIFRFYYSGGYIYCSTCWSKSWSVYHSKWFTDLWE
jgi:hypothetical protein